MKRGERDVDHTGPWREQAVSALGATQRALVTRTQLFELGIGRRAIDHALANGRMHVRHRNVYGLVAPEVLPPLAAELAAVLACQPDAYLGGLSAAGVWRMLAAQVWGTQRRRSEDPAVDVLVVGRDAGRRRPGIDVRRVAALSRWDTRVHEGLPITSPAFTLLEIASELSRRELDWAFDEAVFVKKITTIREVRLTLERCPHRRGAGRLRELIVPGRTSTATRYGGEEFVFELIRKGELPVPEVGVMVGNHKADFYWRRAGVIVELDGYPYHSGRAAFERDHERDFAHQDAGLLVMRVTGRQVRSRPELFLVRLTRALALRSR